MNRYTKYTRTVGCALLLFLTLAQAQTPAPAPTQRVTPNFQNVDITVLADAVGKVTGLTFLPDPRVRGPVNLVNPKPMTPNELYQTFLSILQVNNFTTSRAGNIVKIIPEANMTRMAGNDLPDRINPNSDEIVTTVIELKNISAQQLNPILVRLIPQTSLVQSVTGTNALVIVDHASNVVRIQNLAAKLDEAGSSGVDMIALKNSNASDVARTLTTLVAGSPAEAAGGGVPKVVADDRTNSILVSGDASARQRIATQIANLDKPVADDDNIETRYLKYARAEDVANTLKQQASTILATTSGNAGGAAPAGAGASASSASADRSVNIQFDKPTNMLIVTAPPKTRKALMRIVDQMDIARAQVLLEAIIADVKVDSSSDLGVNWAVFSQENGKVVPGALFDSAIGGTDIATLAKTISDPASATSAPQGGTFALGKLVDNGISWAAMIRALATNTNANVIASPTQVTLDNQEVNLESGQEVPLLSGSYSNVGNIGGAGGGVGGGIGGGVTSPFTTVNRVQLGTKLKITPQLNGSDAMTLTIDLESSELTGTTGDAGSSITDVRKFHNVLLVKDREWIVVGGLIRDSDETSQTRVPFLSRIPLIGNLFKVKSKARSKKNLMVFIRPTIITDTLQAAGVTNDKYKEILDAQAAQAKRAALPAPQMPSLNPTTEPVPTSNIPAGKAPQTSPVP
jgi:general secretion pathway protein D